MLQSASLAEAQSRKGDFATFRLLIYPPRRHEKKGLIFIISNFEKMIVRALMTTSRRRLEGHAN